MADSPIILKSAPLVEKTQIILKAVSAQIASSPRLVVFIIGNHLPSQIYVRQKCKIALALGIDVEVLSLENEINQNELNILCQKYSEDPTCHAILIQLPLPKHLNMEQALEFVDPKKDIDGLTFYNQGLVGSKELFGFAPCTPFGVIRLLKYYSISLRSKNIVVLGRSALVGKPMALLALSEDATVTILHSKSTHIKKLCQQSDILISATGSREILQWEDCLPHQIIIDIGIHKGADGKLHGDLGPVHSPPNVRAYTPVPGGVGPMTINTLMYNIFEAYSRQTQSSWSLEKERIDRLSSDTLIF
jgi:methylenetetrahydrofolate dehydrogenase (NADP+)/methenyltetrahydrofolate cyclohydrolase